MSHVSRVTNLVLLGLVGTALLLAGARADPADDKETEKVLTAEQRAELVKEWRRLDAELGQCLRDGRLREAVRIQERALAACEKLYPEQDHTRLARSLDNMGYLLYSLGEPSKALPYCKRALDVYERLYDKKDHPDLASSLDDIGSVLKSLGEPRNALPYYERALAMYERLHPKQDHLNVANSLNNMGIVLNSLGEPRKALPYCERTLAMYERLYPNQDHLSLANSLNNMGFVLNSLGEPRKALPYYERALAMHDRLYPKQDHPDYASALDNISSLLNSLGEQGKALPYCERALAMRERLYPKQDHPELVNSLNGVGYLLNSLGEPRKALPYYERALAMCEHLYPKQDHPDLATSLHRMGMMLNSLGELQQALPYFERALAMRERLYPKQDHLEVARSLNTMGYLLNSLDEPRKALPYYERSLAIYERLYPKQDHPELATSLNNMGHVLDSLGEPRKALTFIERALAMRERLYPKQDHLDLANSLNGMGYLLNSLGEPRKALAYYERALAICEHLYPKQDHLYLARILNNMGVVLNSLGEPRKALTHWELALRVYSTLLDRNAATASEAETLDFVSALPITRDILLSLTRSLLDKQDAAYGAVWETKAALTRVLQRRHTLVLAAREPKTLDAWQQLADARRQLAFTLRQRAEGKAGLDGEVERLTKLKEQRESELNALLPALKLQQERDRLRPTQLAEALPVGTAFVDLVRYTALEYDPKKPGKDGWKQTPSYAAFILVKGRKLQRVELESAKPIDEAAEAWLRALDAYDPGEIPDTQRQKLAKADERGRELRRLVWDKLAEYLPADTKMVYVSPDGDLARIPWAALPDDKGDGLLLDRYLLGLVPYGPFLLDRLLHPLKKDDGAGRLLAVGGIDYGAGSRYGALKGSVREAEQVIARTGKRPTGKLTEAEATTARLLKELPQVRYVHLATHGFFDEKNLTEERQRLAKQVQDFRLSYQFDQNRTTQFGGQALRSPLAYTGLVLAGANAPDKAGSDGGILSGEAIVDLPLEGMRLCVLSACETGLGELTRDEGVQGLVRAFHLAGCRDVVASLWKVDDAATATLMARFYSEMWDKEGNSPLEALALAQRAVSRRPDLFPALAGLRGSPSAEKVLPPTEAAPTKPLPAEGVRRLPPKYWAAFQLYGTGR